MKNNRFSPEISVFHDRMFPEEGFIAGYAALINSYNLAVPIPEVLSFISLKKREYKGMAGRFLLRATCLTTHCTDICNLH
jgi:hypothetical protein